MSGVRSIQIASQQLKPIFTDSSSSGGSSAEGQRASARDVGNATFAHAQYNTISDSVQLYTIIILLESAVPLRRFSIRQV